MHTNIAGPANEIMYDGAVQHLKPPRSGRFADNDLCHVMTVGIADHVIGDAPSTSWQYDGFAAKRFGEPQCIGDPVAFVFGKLHGAAPFHVERGPWSMEAIGKSLGIAYEPGAARIFADANDYSFARGPWSLNGARLHFRKQLFIDPLGGATQRELAQRGEIGRRKEMLQRVFGLFGNVNLA